MNSKDIYMVAVAIVTLFNILLFHIWDNPIFIIPITLGFGVIGYISLKKENKPVVASGNSR